MQKKIKKTAFAALILSVLTGYQDVYALTTSNSPITAPAAYTDDLEINIAPVGFGGRYGIIASGGLFTNSSGKTTTINLANNQLGNGGIYLDAGGSVKIDQLIINDASLRTGNISFGIENRGGDAQIGNNSHIEGSFGIYTSGVGSSTVIGDDSEIIGSIWGSGFGAVMATDNGLIQFGHRVKISNNGIGMVDTGGTVIDFHHYGLMAYGNGKIIVGDNSEITTDGSLENHAVVAGYPLWSTSASATGLIQIGENAKVTAGGQGSYGLFSQRNDSKITIGNNSVIQATGPDGVAVYAWRGGNIDLMGDQTIWIDERIADYAIIANGNGVIGDNDSLIQADGKLDITGSLYANYGEINLKMHNGSHLKGFSQLGSSGSGKIYLTMDGTAWDMTGNSVVTDLEFVGSQSTVNYLADGGFKNLTVQNLFGGNGHFVMGVDVPNQTGDFLEVTGISSGNHQVTIKNAGSSDVTGEEAFTIIKTADGGAKFSDTGAIELGGYEYQLRDVANTAEQEWEIYGTKKSTGTANAAVHAFSGGYLLNYAETQTLLQRMGDLRNGESKGNIWAHTYGGKFSSTGDGFLGGYDLNYWGFQVGADKKIELRGNKGNLYVGGFFGYAKGDLDYGHGSGDIDSKSLGAYGTYESQNGFYTDVALKYNWMKNKFNVLDSQTMRVTGEDLKTDGLSASIEVGQRIHFDKMKQEGWYVEPQAQLSWGHQSGGTFRASNGLRVTAESYNSLLGRVGANVGYEIKGGKNPINAYAKISFVHEFDGDMDYRLNNSKEGVSFGDSWWTYGLGVTAQLGSRHNVYFDIERAEGGAFTQDWSINGGYRYSW